jgi:hypothetical protein
MNFHFFCSLQYEQTMPVSFLNGQFCCQEMARMQDFTPFIPGLPGAFSRPPAIGHLAIEVAGALRT